MLSRRTSVDRSLNTVAVAIERARAERAPLWDLTVSNPTVVGLAPAASAILPALADARSLVYEPEPFGIASARSAVCDVLGERGVRALPEQVLLTASTSEAYGYAFKLLCDPGDEVLVPEPSYPLFEHLARFDAVRPIPYRLAYDGVWHVDFASVDAARSERTRAIIVVSPNNPTGSYLKHHELARLSELGLPIVSDEVFAEYPLDAPRDRVRSALDSDGVLVLALGGLSKLAGLPQLKLGWAVLGGPRDVVDEARARLELLADAYLSVSAPVQHALPALLAAGSELRARIARRTRANLEMLREIFDGSAVTLLPVEGGWTAPLRLPKTMAEQEWVLGLLGEERVLVQPGWFYDFAEEAFVVVSLLTPEDVLAEGARRLRRFVDR